MNSSDYLSLINSGIGDSRSDVSIAKALAQTLRRSQEDTNNLALLFASLYAYTEKSDYGDNILPGGLVKYPDIVGDYYMIEVTSEEWNDIQSQLQAANQNPVFDPSMPNVGSVTKYTTNTDLDAWVCSVGNYDLLFNGYDIFHLTRNTSHTKFYINILKDIKTYLSDFSDCDLGYIFSNILYGRGVLASYCTILESGAKALMNSSEDPSKYASSISSIVETCQALSIVDKNEFIVNATSGVRGLIDTVTNKIAGFKRDADTATGTVFPGNTSISISEFAPGMILGTIEAILSVVSVVAFAINKIVGAVVAIGGAVLSIVARTMLAVTTAYEDTRFKIAWNREGRDSTFSFCLNRQEISFAALGDYMRENGFSFVTIYDKEYRPLVHYVFLSNPDLPGNTMIQVETHLSLDFDVFQGTGNESTIRSTLAAEGISSLAIDRFFYGTGNFYPHTTGTHSKVYMIENPDTGRKVFLGCPGQIVGYSEINKHAALPFIGFGTEDTDLMTPDEFAQFSYKPLSLPFLSSVTGLFSDGIEMTLWRRLCSGILILWYRLFFYESALPVTASVVNWRHQPWCLAHYNGISLSGILSMSSSELSNFYVGLTYPVRDELGNFVDGDVTTLGSQKKLHLDNVLRGIEILFDQVKFARVLNTTLNNYTADKWNCKYFYWDTQSASDVPNLNDFSSIACNVTFAYMRDEGLLPATSYNLTSILDDDHVIECWPTGLLVDLPTLTFSGYLAGLIVDGLVAIAVIAVTIVAVVAKTKIANRRAQLQARAEQKWYNYSDNYDDSGTAEAAAANSQRWKEYKISRLKYNALAWLTGGSTLSLGLYDEASQSQFSLIGYVTDKFNQSAEQAEASTGSIEDDISSVDGKLDDIKTLITGS